MVYNGNAPSNYRDIHQKYGPIVRVGPNEVSVADYRAIPVIYGVGSKFTKTPFYTLMSPIYQGSIMDSMFSTRDATRHKYLKSSVAQIFSMTNMRNFECYADECTQIFIDAMLDLEGTPVDFSHWLQWYAFDVIGSITFRRRFGFMEKRKDVNNMIAKIDTGLQYVKVLGQLPGGMLGSLQWVLFRLDGAFQRIGMTLLPDTMDRFTKITEEEVDRYENSVATVGVDSQRTDFLAQLREKEKRLGKISQRDMINHLSNNLLAGSDTTAISLRAIFYYVIKNPQVYGKVQNEIDEADRENRLSKFVTYEECLKLPYLQAIMKEAMRLHPGVGFPLERYTPSEGAEICGHTLQGGTNVSISAPVIHYNQEIYGKDADLFRPERWQEAPPEVLKAMDRYFLAFGHGTRTCIGKNISIMEMGKFVPQILRHFRISWASPVPEWQTDAAWFWKQSGLIVRLERRVRA
ncbi:cytochrome P450 [Aspergillus pseudoustus]|uniref:Cytochrome P450 n=1 Tax=Aspergillus pseudoustus TaxID=1810923 RepID=A0ABR4J5U6_9EURO